MFISLLPHAIRIRMIADASAIALDSDIVVEPSGLVARVTATSRDIGTSQEGVPLSITDFGHVYNVPSPKSGVIYIVSALVLNRVADRSDVFAPRTDATAIRDGNGQIFAVRGLQK